MSDRVILRSLPTDPPCPRCGRRYPVKTLKPHAQKPSYHCDPERAIGGCDTRWDPK